MWVALASEVGQWRPAVECRRRLKYDATCRPQDSRLRPAACDTGRLRCAPLASATRRSLRPESRCSRSSNRDDRLNAHDFEEFLGELPVVRRAVGVGRVLEDRLAKAGGLG